MPTFAGQMQTATAEAAGGNAGGVLAGAEQTALLTLFTTTPLGGFSITVDNVTYQVINDWTGVTTMAAAATVIANHLGGAGTCTFAAGQFTIRSATTGPLSVVTYATAPTSGTDLSGMTGFKLNAASGASIAPGTSPLGPQWIPCTGRTFYPQRWHNLPAPGFPLPHTAPSFGDGRDWLRNVNRWGGAYRIHNRLGGLCRIPYDPSGTWYVSVADHSGETSLVNPPTVQKPPPGVK